MHTACVWSEKLPFAGYSVVKDHSGLRPEPRLGRSRGPKAPLRSLAARLRSLIIRGSAPNPGSVARGTLKPRCAPSQLACARCVAARAGLRSRQVIKIAKPPETEAFRA